MDTSKRRGFLAAAALALILLLAVPQAAEHRQKDGELVVGVGDDITGRLMDQVLARFHGDGQEGLVSPEPSGTDLV